MEREHFRSERGGGQKTANALGLRDMSGNVGEWCYDLKTVYSGGSESGPIGPASGSDRECRGTDWDGLRDYLRSAKRFESPPANRDYIIGLRLCGTAD